MNSKSSIAELGRTFTALTSSLPSVESDPEAAIRALVGEPPRRGAGPTAKERIDSHVARAAANEYQQVLSRAPRASSPIHHLMYRPSKTSTEAAASLPKQRSASRSRRRRQSAVKTNAAAGSAAFSQPFAGSSSRSSARSTVSRGGAVEDIDDENDDASQHSATARTNATNKISSSSAANTAAGGANSTTTSQQIEIYQRTAGQSGVSPIVVAARTLHGGVHSAAFQYYDHCRRDPLLFPSLTHHHQQALAAAAVASTTTATASVPFQNILSPRAISSSARNRTIESLRRTVVGRHGNTIAVVDSGLESLLPPPDPNPVSTARGKDLVEHSCLSPPGRTVGHWPKLPAPQPVFTQVVAPRKLIVNDKDIRNAQLRAKNQSPTKFDLPKSILDAGRRGMQLGKEVLKAQALKREQEEEEQARKKAAQRRRLERIEREMRMKAVLGKV